MLSNCTILNSSVKVSSLECGALAHGGATQIGDVIYSNISTGESINFRQGVNGYGIMIPSTVDIDQVIDSEEYVDKYIKKLELVATGINRIKARGSWYSEELGRVIVEDVTILTFTSDYEPSSILKFMLLIGEKVKKDMQQEAISIIVNEGLIIA